MDQTKTVLIRNIPVGVTFAELSALFSHHYPVAWLAIMKHPVTEKPTGQAICIYHTQEAAYSAVNRFNNQHLPKRDHLPPVVVTYLDGSGAEATPPSGNHASGGQHGGSGSSSGSGRGDESARIQLLKEWVADYKKEVADYEKEVSELTAQTANQSKEIIRLREILKRVNGILLYHGIVPFGKGDQYRRGGDGEADPLKLVIEFAHHLFPVRVQIRGGMLDDMVENWKRLFFDPSFGHCRKALLEAVPTMDAEEFAHTVSHIHRNRPSEGPFDELVLPPPYGGICVSIPSSKDGFTSSEKAVMRAICEFIPVRWNDEDENGWMDGGVEGGEWRKPNEI